MWCRVLLVVTALTCTLQREIMAEPDDVLCVIYLSGLQKEDLGADLLKKLQRHNVSISDYNENNIKRCFRSFGPERSRENETASFEKIISTTISDIPKDDIQSRKNTAIKRNSIKSDTMTSDVKKFIDFWMAHGKTNGHKITTKAKNYLTVSPIQDKTDSRTRDVFINNMLESNISPQDFRTLTPTTMQQLDIMWQKTRNISRDQYKNKISKDKNTNAKEPRKSKDEETFLRENDSIPNRMFREIYQINVSEALKCKSEDEKQPNYLKFVQTDGLSDKMPNTLDKDTKMDTQSMNLDIIKKMLEFYTAPRLGLTTTLKPIPTPKDLDNISKQIKMFLDNKNNYFNSAFATGVSGIENMNVNKLHKVDDEKSVADRSDPLLNELLRQKYLTNVFGSLKSITDDRKLDNLRIVKPESHLNDQIPNTTKATVTDSQSINLDEISILLDYYNAVKQALTQKQTTTQNMDLLSQKMNEFLQKNINYNNVITNQTPQRLENGNANIQESQQHKNELTRKRGSLEHTNELGSEKHESNMMYDPLKDNFKNVDIIDSPQMDQKNQLHRQAPVTINKNIEMNPQLKDTDYIYKKFESFLNTQHVETTTVKPTRTVNNMDIISKQMKEILENNYYIKNEASVTKLPEPTKNHYANVFKYNNAEQMFSNSNDISQFLRHAFNNMSGFLNSNFKETENSSNAQNMQKNVFQVNKTNNTLITDIKVLPDNIIKEITQKLKASIFEDLQKQMSSTLQFTKQNTSTTDMTITTTPKIVQDNIPNETELDHFNKQFKSFKKESDTGNTTETNLAKVLIQIDDNKVRAATAALESVIKLIQEFKKIKGSVMEDQRYTVTQKKNCNNEFHGPINIICPPMLPVKYAYNGKTQTAREMPVFVHPNKPLKLKSHNLQTTDAIKQIEDEKFKLQARLEELSNINLNPSSKTEGKVEKEFILHPVAIIQTDAEQVPLLGIPVPKSVRAINQNIIVTTLHPMVQFQDEQKYRIYKKKHKPRYQDHKARNEEGFSTDTKIQSNVDKAKTYHSNLERQFKNNMERFYRTELERHSDTEMEIRYSDSELQSDTNIEKRFHTDAELLYKPGHEYLKQGRYTKPFQSKKDIRSQKPRNKLSSSFDNIYRQYITKSRPTGEKNGDHPLPPSNHHKERYHEKLEKPHEKQRYFEENKTMSKEDKRLKVASRHQLSMNELKKKPRYDDTHFRNFLKTQEKVNNMLEKILAQNVKVRSVETPDTIHDLVN